MGDNTEVKTGSSSSKPPTSDAAGGPIIQESQESEEYQQDLQVVLGTAFGVIAVVGLIALTFLLYRIYKSRRTAISYGQTDDMDAFERDIAVDVEGKSQPVILLLYAYDCPIHEQVVGALAGFLMEACGVTVTLDLLEENETIERGVDDWLVGRLQEADYILVLCSLGARLRCSKKHVRFKTESQRVLPDYFAVAVDYVAEKMRAEKQKGLSVNKFLTAYMEYSTRSDIPPQLETAIQFCLMKDIHKLHTHLNTQGPDTEKSETESQTSTCAEHYHETETGALLKATIEQAKAYFRENPTWMDDRLEQVTALGLPGRGLKSRKRRRNSMEQPLLMLMGTPPVLQCPNQDSSCNNVSGVNMHSFPQTQFISSQHLPLPTHDRMVVPNTCHTLPRTTGTSLLQECEQYGHGSGGIFQGRQNSLPSSLASSCIAVPPTRHALSKSMDSFAMDQSIHPEHDGLPCFYCNSTHMDGRPECRQMEHHKGRASIHLLTSNDLSLEPSRTSLNLPPGGLGPSRSQTTVLQAEVHQEWGHSNKGTPEKKSATFAGDPRSWNSDLDISTASPFQSLPPHFPPPHQYPPPSSVTEWDGPSGLRKWTSGYPDSPSLQDVDGQDHRHHRTLSDVSLSTDDSGSISDGDSLERDLRSVQNISSFLDFVTSTSFNGGRISHRTFDHPASTSLEMTSVLKPLGAFPDELNTNRSPGQYKSLTFSTPEHNMIELV